LTFRELPVWIIENLRESLTLENLAAWLSSSPRNFSRQFVKNFGVTPQRFVTRPRVEMAKRPLAESARSREDIAIECDFGPIDALERALRRDYGASARSAPRPIAALPNWRVPEHRAHGHTVDLVSNLWSHREVSAYRMGRRASSAGGSGRLGSCRN
jgi:AraC-like DNA-binding protein